MRARALLNSIAPAIAALRAAGVPLVGSGAIALGLGTLGSRPPRAGARAAGGLRRGPGSAAAPLGACAQAPRRPGRPGASDLGRRASPRRVRERARHARDAHRLGPRPGRERERLGGDRRDHLRRQRRARRPGRGAPARPAAGAPHRHRRPLRPRSARPGAQRLAEVTDHTMLETLELRPGRSTWGSGGMRSKVVAAEMARSGGVAVVIANGRSAGVVAAAAAGGPVGTRFSADPSPLSAYKLWVRYGKPVRGKVSVDAGALRAITAQGTSLLAVGVPEVDGSFAPGDTVEVAGPDGTAFAVGLRASSAAATRARRRGRYGRGRSGASRLSCSHMSATPPISPPAPARQHGHSLRSAARARCRARGDRPRIEAACRAIARPTADVPRPRRRQTRPSSTA